MTRLQRGRIARTASKSIDEHRDPSWAERKQGKQKEQGTTARTATTTTPEAATAAATK